jgi:hypothetical protein
LQRLDGFFGIECAVHAGGQCVRVRVRGVRREGVCRWNLRDCDQNRGLESSWGGLRRSCTFCKKKQGQAL